MSENSEKTRSGKEEVTVIRSSNGQKMEQPIMDYASFFAGARQVVQELEQLKQKEKELESQEKQLENSLKVKQRTIADSIAQTVKQRGDEIAKSYDAEIGKLQDRLKKARTKREKAKNQGVKERIAEDTQSLVKEIEEIKRQRRTIFKANHVPGYCCSSLYYSLYFTKGFRDVLVMLSTLLILFLAIPCGIYFLIPDRKTWYMAVIYVLDILIFGGIYVKVGNSTKLKYMDVLKEGCNFRDRIRAAKKQIRIIARTIRKDKNDTVYNLEKFDDEIAQLDQDLAMTNRQKKDALNTFDTVTKTIISDEIMGNHKAEVDQMEAELSQTIADLKNVRASYKEKVLFAADHYEVYAGKEFMTMEKLTALEDIIRNGEAKNISEAETVYLSRENSHF